MMKKVTFKNKTIDMAGNIYYPKSFDEGKKYAAIVCVHPGSSVKEQTAGLYAEKMASKGFVTLAFDASYQGESGGEPRFLEDPSARVEDIRCAIDFITTLPFVDEERIGVLGICAGGGYSVSAAMTEKRIKAIGTVVGGNVGSSMRGSLENSMKTLEEVGRQRSREARGESALISNWIPNTLEEAEKAGVTELDLMEAVLYYRTPRGQHQNSTNQYYFTSLGLMMAFDAFHLVEKMLTQPLQIIIGNKVGAFGSYNLGKELFERANCKKDLLIIEGASHYDLYDIPQYVDQAVAKLEVFYKNNLS